MFCYSSIDEIVIRNIRNDNSIYITSDGRIGLPGLNENNIDYVV